MAKELHLNLNHCNSTSSYKIKPKVDLCEPASAVHDIGLCGKM